MRIFSPVAGRGSPAAAWQVGHARAGTMSKQKWDSRSTTLQLLKVMYDLSPQHRDQIVQAIEILIAAPSPTDILRLMQVFELIVRPERRRQAVQAVARLAEEEPQAPPH